MITAQKGTKDIYGEEMNKWHFVENAMREVFENANYKELRTPIFEATELFARGVGDSTDIVNKEMYTFDQKGRSLTLRPENTAGVVRAYIEHGMHRISPPVKLFYKGPMFRYERPQAGRQRQFHQLGVEVFGVDAPSADAEVISTAIAFLNKIGLDDLELEINSLGCEKCRANFREKLKAAIAPMLENFCDDCKMRYDKNPLRMLDCKSPECQQYLATQTVKDVINSEFICEDCQEHFEKLKSYLNALEIKYSVNKLLVRGLDYYNRTVFEIKSNSLGSQNAVCGGGRYDSLVETLGGVKTPAVGWAMGMERLMALIPDVTAQKIDAYIISQDLKETLKMAKLLRSSGLKTEFDMQGKNFSKGFEKALKSGATFAIILGEDEIKENKVTIKNLTTKEQKTIASEKILEELK